MKWKWSNVPIPEIHLLGLFGGILLQIYYPNSLSINRIIRLPIGLLFMLTGILISAWSVISSGKMDIAAPKKIITSGPYSISRNPMYVGWSLLVFGIGIALGNLWIIYLLIPVILITHFFVILKEEQFLGQEFGEEFAKYTKSVRRYL